MLLESGTFLQKKVKIGNFLRKSMSLDERTGQAASAIQRKQLRLMYDFKNSFLLDFLYIHRAKYILFKERIFVGIKE